MKRTVYTVNSGVPKSMMGTKKLILKKAWITIFTCKCGNKMEYWHGSFNKKPKKIDYPSSGEYNGWKISPYIVCYRCRKD